MTGPTAAASQVADWLRTCVDAGRMPGAVWWIGGRGGATGGVVGLSSVEPSAESASADTPYDLASLTKPLATALLAVLLEDEGVLRLDAPVHGLLPELAGTPAGERTLLDLGSHRAGLAAWRPLYLEAASREEYLTALAREDTSATGGELYSDLGYLLLGFAVERAGEAPLDALFRSRVASRLGRRIGVPGPEDRFRDAAPTEGGNVWERGMAGKAGEGHRWRTAIPRGEVHDGNAHGLGGVAGHAGLFGTAEAVASLALELLAPERLPLSARARRRLLEPASPGVPRTFGFVLAAGSAAARGVLPGGSPGHTGFTGTSLWLLPDEGRALDLLTNRVHPVVDGADFQPVRAGFHARAREVRP